MANFTSWLKDYNVINELEKRKWQLEVFKFSWPIGMSLITTLVFLLGHRPLCQPPRKGNSLGFKVTDILNVTTNQRQGFVEGRGTRGQVIKLQDLEETPSVNVGITVKYFVSYSFKINCSC